MNRFNVLLLVAVVAVLGVAWWVATLEPTEPQGTGGVVPGGRGPSLLAGLAEGVASVDRVVVERGGLTAEYHKLADGQWVEGLSGHPVRAEPVRALLVTLARFKADTPRTANPANHAQLGLAWPDALGESRRVRVGSSTNAALAFDVLLGRETADPDHTYARPWNKDQTYRLNGRPTAEADATAWMEPDTAAVSADDAVSMRFNGLSMLKQADGSWHAERTETQAPLSPVWADEKLAESATVLPALLQTARFDAVEAHPSDAETGSVKTLEFAMRDGSTVQAHLQERDDRWWVRLTTQPAPTATEPTEGSEADETPVSLSASQALGRTGQWWYRLPMRDGERLTGFLSQPATLPSTQPATLPETPATPFIAP